MSSAALQGQLETTVSETSPLLESSSSGDYHAITDCEALKPASARHIHDPTPLPRKQLASLCIVRFAEPINFTQIFPYVNEQIKNLHICDPNSVGVYSGIIESSFAVAQLFSVMQWAKLSDKIGRRPVIFAGTLGVMLTTLLFGMAKSFWLLVVARALAGIFCGNVAVLQSMLGEITDSTNQAAAFPLFAMTWPVGAIIGPLIGGSLSNPADKFSFLDFGFLRDYPYFLPCFTAAIVSLIGFTLGYLFLEETLPSKIQARTRPRLPDRSPSEDTLVEFDGAAEEVVGTPPSSASIRALLQVPVIRALSVSGCAVSFFATSFDVVFVLFAYSPVNSGGLGLSDSQIGYTLAIAGLIASSIQIFFMPSLLRRFDAGKMYWMCIRMYPMAFAMMPMLNIIARSAVDDASSHGSALVWLGIAVTMLFARISNVSFALSMILTRQHAPSQDVLGSVNGLVQWSMCLARAFAPTVVSTAYALSQEYQLMGGYFWAFFFGMTSLVAGFAIGGSETFSQTKY